KDCSAANVVILKCVQGTVRFRQWKYLDARSNRNLGRHAQKVFAVLPRVVRHAANHSLLIQQVVAERWDRTPMNSAENKRAAFSQRLQCCRNNLPSGGKDNCRVEFLCRFIERSA